MANRMITNLILTYIQLWRRGDGEENGLTGRIGVRFIINPVHNKFDRYGPFSRDYSNLVTFYFIINTNQGNYIGRYLVIIL